MDISERSRQLSSELALWRRTLHTFPETGTDTVRTASYIKARLDEMGVGYTSYLNGCGLAATVGSNQGKTIALRSDIDGLPICEETGLSFASVNGCMHACGHDSHAAMGLGVAMLLKEMETEIPGKVKIIFQPGEETLSGAKEMIREGVLENPRPDMILVVHTTNARHLEPGSIRVTHGMLCASTDMFEIEVKGSGGHCAEPEKSEDVITAVSGIIGALQCIISRETGPMTDALLSVTDIHAGNGSFNILPGHAVIRGTYRTHDEDVRTFISRRIREISCKIASAMRTVADVKIIEGVPSLKNDNRITDVVVSSYMEVDDRKSCDELGAIMGGDDAAFYFSKIPGTYFMLNAPMKTEGVYYPLHSSRYNLDDSILYIGVETVIRTIFNLFKLL